MWPSIITSTFSFFKTVFFSVTIVLWTQFAVIFLFFCASIVCYSVTFLLYNYVLDGGKSWYFWGCRGWCNWKFKVLWTLTAAAAVGTWPDFRDWAPWGWGGTCSGIRIPHWCRIANAKIDLLEIVCKCCLLEVRWWHRLLVQYFSYFERINSITLHFVLFSWQLHPFLGHGEGANMGEGRVHPWSCQFIAGPCQQLYARHLAQGYHGIALKVFRQLSLLPEHLPRVLNRFSDQSP